MLKKAKSVDNIAAGYKKSGLTRKPAGLKASDFNASSVKVVLEDGSGITLWYSSTTNCKTLVCKAIEKSKLKDKIDKDQYQLQVRLNSGQLLFPKEMDLVANVVGLDIDKVLLIKSSSCPSTARNRKLLKAVSVEKMSYKFASNPVSAKSKRTNKLLKLKLFHKSETNLVISPPIPDSEFNALVSCPKDPDRQSFYDKYQCSKPTGLYRLDRKKSLSTGNLFALTLDEPQVPMHNLVSSSPRDFSQAVFPELPKRTCSFPENCSTDDQYLIQQGLRLQRDLPPLSQRWSDSACDEVGDIEPTYDSLLAVADVDPVYDTPIAAHSLKNSGCKMTSSDTATSLYVNFNISTNKEKVLFGSNQVHMYDTPRPITNLIDSTEDPDIGADVAGRPGSVKIIDDDYVSMFEGVHDTPVVQKPSALPLSPLPAECGPSGSPRARDYASSRDRPWLSPLTNTPPALPPRPPSITRDKSEEFKPPPLLVPCNSFDDSVAKGARLSLSTSSPCLCQELQHGEDDSEDHVYDSPPLTPYADAPIRKPSTLPSSLSNSCLFNDDMATLNKLLSDLNELALT